MEEKHVQISYFGPARFSRPFPKTVTLSEEAQLQLASLRKIFNHQEFNQKAEFNFSVNRRDNKLHVQLFPNCAVYSKDSGIRLSNVEYHTYFNNNIENQVDSSIRVIYSTIMN